MNYKKQIGLIFRISILWILFDIFVLCQPSDPNWTCQKSPSVFTQILSLFCFVFVLLSPPLYLLKEGVYLAWRKFTLWYLPIVAILIFSAGGYGGGNGFNPGYGMDSESLTFFFSGLFVLTSLLLIIYKSIKLKGK